MTEETRQIIEAEKTRFDIACAEPVSNLVKTGVNAAVLAKIETDKTIQDNFNRTADKVIGSGLSQAQAEAEKTDKEAYKRANQDACDLYGIDENTVPKWVVRIARIVQNVWYAVWLVVASVTVAPIVFLSKKIRVVFKKSAVAITLAIIIYLAIAVVPIIVTIIKSKI